MDTPHSSPAISPTPSGSARRRPSPASTRSGSRRRSITRSRREAKNPRDLALNHYQTFGREPFGYVIGPIKERGDQTGLVVHKGYIVAEWGEPAARRHDPQHHEEHALDRSSGSRTTAA